MPPNPNSAPILLRNLKFAYTKGPDVLHIKDLQVQSGECVFLHGPSGCGKTTLLGLIAGVLKGATGELSILGHDFIGSSGSARDRVRGDHLGYIFQMFNLIPYLSVCDNITLPVQMSKLRRTRLAGKDPKVVAHSLCDSLGISAFFEKRVTELSVGQQQRVAAARALMGAPELIIADEPTSSLDFDHRASFLKLLFAQCQAQNTALLFVSHDRELKSLFSRSVSLPEINLAAKVYKSQQAELI